MVREKALKFGDLFERKITRKHIPDEEEVTFIGMEDVSEEGRIINQNLIKYSEVKKGLTYFEKDDVIVAKITPCFENRKGACLDELKTEKGFGSTEFHVLRARANVEPRYIYYHTQFKRFRKQLETEMVGSAGQKRVPIKSIINYSLSSNHTLPEQKAIAKVLSDVDELIASIDKLIDKKQNIKQGTMQLLLTGKKRLPGFTGEWEVKRLGEIVTITSGESPSRFLLQNSGTPYYKVEQLNNCIKYQLETPYYIECQNPIRKGSIVFPKRGAAILLNKVRILVMDSYIDTNLMALTVPNPMSNEYLYYLLINRELWRIADTTSIPQINNKHINQLTILLPPLSEQKAIAQILSDMDSEIEALEKKLHKYKLIKEGMMEKLLTGKVRLV